MRVLKLIPPLNNVPLLERMALSLFRSMKNKNSSILLAKPRVFGIVMFKIFNYSSRNIKNRENMACIDLLESFLCSVIESIYDYSRNFPQYFLKKMLPMIRQLFRIMKTSLQFKAFGQKIFENY